MVTNEIKEKIAFTPIPNVIEKDKITSKIHPFLAVFIVTLGAFGLGCVLAWTSPALPQIEKQNEFGTLFHDQTSWITSLAILGALVAGPLSGFLVNGLGCKLTMILMTAPFMIGWLLIGFAQNVPMIYIGRFLTGLTGGSFTVSIPVYVSEIAEDSLRGTLGSGMVLMLVTGILFTYSLGSLVSWRILTYSCTLIPILAFIGLVAIVPESPRFLLSRGKNNRAARSLKWLRGETSEKIENELNKIKESLDLNKNGADDEVLLGSDRSSSNKIKNLCLSFSHLLQFSHLKPIALSLTLMFFQQMSGINAVQSYTVKIFTTASPALNPNISTIVVGVVQVIFVLLSMVLVDKAGRKFLLISSFSLMALSLLSLGAFFTSNLDEVSILPLISVIVFVISYSFGVGPLPWVLFAEIVHPNIKSVASSIVTSFYWIIAFISIISFEYFSNALGWHGYYWALAILNAAGALFTVIFLPETKGKSSDEIQKYFNKDSLEIQTQAQDSKLTEQNECDKFIV